MAMLWKEAPWRFIDSFCDPRSVCKDFKNELGGFTPCFIDIILLGVAHVVAILLCVARICYLHSRRVLTFRLRGRARLVHCAAILLALACLLIVLFQLNARIAADTMEYIAGDITPFEWIGYPLSGVSWLLFAVAFALELDRYSPRRTWLLRFPLCLIFAGQLAKLRFVVLMSEEHDYFFWMWLVYAGLQAVLVALAIFHYPSRKDMEASEASLQYRLLDAPEFQRPDAKVCPEATTNWVSYVTFAWAGPLMRLGYKQPLQFDNIWDLPPDDRVESVAAKFERFWDQEKQKGEGASLTRACWHTTRGLFLAAIPLKLTNDAAQFIGPTFLNLLLGVVQAGGAALTGYTYALIMLLGLLLGTLADNQHFQRVMRAGYRLRAVLVHEVFVKVLALSPTARAEFSSGRVFNLVTSDAETLQLLCQSIMGIISSPLRIVVAMALLYVQLGPASLVALLTLMLMMPIQAVMVRKSSSLMRKALQFTDERAKLEGELLAGLDVVKCNTWEDPFWARILAVRTDELATLWKGFVVASINSLLLNAIPVIVSVATFAAYVLLGNQLTAAKAFTSLSLFTVLRMPLFQLPQLITQLVNARVALQRLQSFLVAEEQPNVPPLPPAKKGQTAIQLTGEFTWDKAAPPSLLDIRLALAAGSLVAVVGPTGSGKSSLLAAALGLMQQISGDPPCIRGKVAYVPQSAFIFNATIRENILFGLPFEEDRYRHAVQAASLGPDLVHMPAGDLTELGERGVNVSGGQKQRISIARAVYSQADVFLLDDPLSALDAKVGREVFNNCIAGVLKDTTRVLVTNQLQFVSAADLIIMMQDGRIAEMGTYQQLLEQDKAFAQLMSQAEVEQDAGQAPSLASQAGDEERPAEAVPAPAAGETAPGSKDGSLTIEESRSTGQVSLEVLGVYIQAMGGPLRFTLLLLWFILVEAARVGATVWLAYWTQVADRPGGAGHPALWYLAIYSAISAAQILFTLLSQFVLKSLSIKAADSLHSRMLKQLIGAPMSFFHTTPLGRVINRLTKDTSDVDKNLADFAAFFLRSMLQLLSTVVLIGAVTPFALPALVPILLLFYWLYQYFQASVREVKRLDAISRSPVYSSIGEGISGVATIRAYRAEERVSRRNCLLVDANVAMSLVNMSMNRWLSVRLESLGALAAFAAAALAVEQRGAASLMGLTLSYALQITQLTSMTVRLASVAENSFNAVERIAEYCDIAQERPPPPNEPPAPNWPAAGKVEMKDVQMRYRPGLPLVLKGLSVTVPAGTRCGVVGRTGAGKSSLINSLFRLMELDSGSICIDGVDISQISLHRLRASMAIIPQVPVLFTGSMRSNLAPFGEASDAEMWSALRRAHLASVVEAHPLGLDMVLSEGGAPLSAGQKQLVALARALLRHSKVLVLDEATANVDVETDALIQKTVREEFADCTIIAIAHRLHTIIDCDCVLVMDHGQCAEFGAPKELLSHPDGVFSSMVAETGDATARFLRSVAAGEADGRADLEQRAAKGLERARLTPKWDTCRALSGELVDKARVAAEVLRRCLDVLADQADSDQVRRGLGLEGSAGRAFGEDCHEVEAATRDAMLQALQYLSDITLMAEKVGRRQDQPSLEMLRANGIPALASVPENAACTPEPHVAVDLPALAGRSFVRTTSLPSNTPGRASLDAPRLPATGDTLSSSAPAASAKRYWNKLRGVPRTLSGYRQLNSAYLRLANEDPSLSNDPSLR
ncbi:hypothetical protein WJX72_012534 [[Myrmecia] bisecta]|uniref:Uncharacterized protein n=1 Tax=[Myrmecia] bisecta TaxID=41462 RepID=A0AAW1P248_9CHLO